MTSRALTYARRTAQALLEALAVCVFLLLLAGAVLVWRLSTGPVDVNFAREYIEEALSDPATGTNIRLGGVVVEWPDLSEPLQLSLRNIQLRRDGRNMVTVRAAGLGISAPHLLIGRIQPVQITLNRPVLRMVRSADNHFSLNLHSEEIEDTDAQAVASEHNLQNLLAILANPEKEGASLFRSLDSVSIENAALIVEDHVLRVSWYLQDMALEFGRDVQGLAIQAGIVLPGGAKGEARLTLDAIYGRADRAVHFNLDVDNFDPMLAFGKMADLAVPGGLSLTLSGRVSGMVDREFALQQADIDLRSDNGMLDFPGVYDAPLSFQDLTLAASYDGQTGAVAGRRLTLRAHDIAVNAAFDVEPTGGGYAVPVRLHIPELAQDRLDAVWPDALRGDGAEIWMVHNMSGGHARNIDVSFTLDLARADGEGAAWQSDVKNIEAAFEIAEMDIDYRAPLTPVRGASGRGAYREGDLNVDITSGTVADMAVRAGRVVLDNVADARNGTANITIDLAGPLRSVFTYIADEPIGMGPEELGIDAKNVEGAATLAIGVSFPMIADLLAEQVVVTVDGTLNDVHLPDVVGGLALTGGPLQLSVKDASAALKGEGKLDGRPINFEWHQYLDSKDKPYASRVKARLPVDAGLRDALGVNIADWVEGAFDTEIIYTELKGGRSSVDVSAQLGGGTVIVKPFRYKKLPGVEGLATCTVHLQDGYVVEVAKLNIQSPELKVTDANLTFKIEQGESVLRQGKAAQVRLIENDFHLEFEIDKDDRVRLKARGAFMDARPFITDPPEKERHIQYDGPAIIADITMDQMRTHTYETVQMAGITMDMARDGAIRSLDMTARAGQGDIDLRLRPDESGRMRLHLAAGDAGAALRAFNIYQNVRGGTLLVEGAAPDISNPRAIEGHAALRDFRVVNAPVLARLLNALSLPGILQLLGSDGIDFTRLEADFTWLKRSGGDLYAMRDGRTAGASMGLNFAGTIDKGQNITDITGTIVPASGVNKLVSHIPILGELLAGGRDSAIFAATYTIRGPTEEPDVSVNPLSVLAPGILRRIFFEE